MNKPTSKLPVIGLIFGLLAILIVAALLARISGSRGKSELSPVEQLSELEERTGISFPKDARLKFSQNQLGLKADCVFATVDFSASELDSFLKTGPMARVYWSKEANYLARLNFSVLGWNPEKCKKYQSGTLLLNQREEASITLCFDKPERVEVYIYILST